MSTIGCHVWFQSDPWGTLECNLCLRVLKIFLLGLRHLCCQLMRILTASNSQVPLGNFPWMKGAASCKVTWPLWGHPGLLSLHLEQFRRAISVLGVPNALQVHHNLPSTSTQFSVPHFLTGDIPSSFS